MKRASVLIFFLCIFMHLEAQSKKTYQITRTQKAPTIITNKTAAIFIITITLFAFAASLVPLTNNAVTIGGTSVALGAALTATSGALTIGGNGSSGGVTINDGSLQMRTGTGNVAEIRMYCETGNAHYQTLKAAPHSAASSAVLVLPTTSGNLIGSGDTGTVANSMMAANSVDSNQYVDGSIDTIHIADDNVTFAKLENRYTGLSALGTASSFALDFSTATTFTATSNGNATFTFSNAKQGQVIDLILSGNHTQTFSQTNATFNKVGSTDYDGSANNLIQIVCTNDSANPIYMYSVQPYASDPTP